MKPFKIEVDGRPIILTILQKTYIMVPTKRGIAYVDYCLDSPLDPDKPPRNLDNAVIKDLFRLAQAHGLFSHDECANDRLNPATGEYIKGTRICTMIIARGEEVGQDNKDWVAVEGS